MAAIPRIEVAESDGVRMVRFLESRLFDERSVREASEQLQTALPASGPIRLIVDLTGVESISSSFLSKLILIQRRVDASGGGLRLCELGGQVQAVFRTSNLDRLFAIHRDRREALETFRR